MSYETLRCSGCMKGQHEIFVLVALAVPDTAVCNECIALCAQIIGERWAQTSHHLVRFGKEKAAEAKTVSDDRTAANASEVVR